MMEGFNVERFLNRQVVVRDRTGNEYHGVLLEIHREIYGLKNGDGTMTFINRDGSNVVSIRVLP